MDLILYDYIKEIQAQIDLSLEEYMLNKQNDSKILEDRITVFDCIDRIYKDAIKTTPTDDISSLSKSDQISILLGNRTIVYIKSIDLLILSENCRFGYKMVTEYSDTISHDITMYIGENYLEPIDNIYSGGAVITNNREYKFSYTHYHKDKVWCRIVTSTDHHPFVRDISSKSIVINKNGHIDLSQDEDLLDYLNVKSCEISNLTKMFNNTKRLCLENMEIPNFEILLNCDRIEVLILCDIESISISKEVAISLVNLKVLIIESHNGININNINIDCFCNLNSLNIKHSSDVANEIEITSNSISSVELHGHYFLIHLDMPKLFIMDMRYAYGTEPNLIQWPLIYRDLHKDRIWRPSIQSESISYTRSEHCLDLYIKT